MSRELYATYSIQTPLGNTTGRCTLTIETKPDKEELLTVKEIENIEEHLKEKLKSTVQNIQSLHLTWWQWLQSDKKDKPK